MSMDLIDLTALETNPSALARWAAEHAEAFQNGRAYGRLEGYEEARVILAPIAEDLAYELYAGRLAAHETAEKVSRLFEVHLNRRRSEHADAGRSAHLDDHRIAA